MSWFFLAIVSTFFYGVQNFIFKVAAERRMNSGRVMFSFSATVAFLSVAAFFLSNQAEKDLNNLLLLSLCNAVAFFIATITKAEALKRIDSSVFFPLDRLYILIVVGISFVAFDERLSPVQILGVLLAVIAFVMLGHSAGNGRKTSKKKLSSGLILTFASLAASSLSVVAVKYASLELNKFAFMAVSYCVNVVLSLAFMNKLEGRSPKGDPSGAIKLGALIGAFNFVGFYILLKAYSAGPLSIVAVIQSMSFVLSLVLSLIVYREKIGFWRYVSIALSIAAIVLLKI